jgi:hypothetical protein
VSVTIRTPGASDQAGDLVDVMLTPDQRGRGHGQRARAVLGRRCLPHRHLKAARGEALAQQCRQVVAYQPSQLGGRAERAIGRLLPDPGEQIAEARFALGRRRLDVQQPWQRLRQLELLLDAGQIHVRADLAVALPVEAYEHVALLQIGPIQLLRRVWPRPRLEHHRRQPQR